MTKQEAKREFAESVVLCISTRDIPAIRQAWNDYVDGLQKLGYVTKRQAETWVNPFLNKKDR